MYQHVSMSATEAQVNLTSMREDILFSDLASPTISTDTPKCALQP